MKFYLYQAIIQTVLDRFVGLDKAHRRTRNLKARGHTVFQARPPTPTVTDPDPGFPRRSTGGDRVGPALDPSYASHAPILKELVHDLRRLLGPLLWRQEERLGIPELVSQLPL